MIKSVVAKTASHLRRAGAFLFFEPGFGKLRGEIFRSVPPQIARHTSVRRRTALATPGSARPPST